MQIQESISLKQYNTFGIDVKAAFFVSISTVQELQELLSNDKYPDPFVMGGGSNMLLTQDVKRLVIHLNSKGKEIINDSFSETDVDTLSRKRIKTPTLKDISNAVIEIRQSKLPDPKKIGNSGSFFKNPVISQKDFDVLKESYPEVPFYPIENDKIKVPAGWLIEQAGFKGKRYGDASGKEIWEVAMAVQAGVKNKFNILIEPEVNVF